MNRTRDIPVALPASESLRAVRRARIPVIWAIPLLAIIAGGYLVFERLWAVGPLITVTFKDGDGLLAGQTPLRYRGVPIGMVRLVKLSPDAQRAEVVARLDRSATRLASEGAQFWIVRPQVSGAGLQGLQTIVSGPFIEVEPGHGKPQTFFTGLDAAPPSEKLRGGLELVLSCSHIGTLNSGAPVYYRGMEVGAVENVMLNSDASGMNIKVCIQAPFAVLVRRNTVFWNAGGLDVTLKLFGVNVSAESVRSLIVGGIAFATPSPAGPPVAANSKFVLQDKPDQKWLKWETPIPGWVANGPTNTLPPSSLSPSSPQGSLGSALDKVQQ